MKTADILNAIVEATKQYAYWHARHPRTLDLLSDCCTCETGMNKAKQTIIDLTAKLSID